MMRREGFTLLEALTTVIVIGILASIAIPNYRRTVERGYWQEAQDMLMTIYYGERSYFLMNNAYTNTGGWETIGMADPNLGAIPVTFVVAIDAATTGCAANGACFRATATRTDGRCMTIDQTRTLNLAPAGCTAWPQP